MAFIFKEQYMGKFVVNFQPQGYVIHDVTMGCIKLRNHAAWTKLGDFDYCGEALSAASSRFRGIVLCDSCCSILVSYKENPKE